MIRRPRSGYGGAVRALGVESSWRRAAARVCWSSADRGARPLRASVRRTPIARSTRSFPASVS